MEIINSTIEEIIGKVGYVCKEKYSDKQLNIWFNYWYFWDEKEKEITERLGVSLEVVLYSKYYWCTQFKNRFNELYGIDVAIDQQQYKIIEEMDRRINDVNWGFIQMIEEGKRN